MADNQEEKIILAVRKSGMKVTEVLEKLRISKQTWYNRIRKQPLDPIFAEDLQKIGVKLDFLSNEKAGPTPENPEDIVSLKKEIDRLRKEVTDLQRELLEIYKKK
jgi:polyhydroxyalkanoate synthesis regulator phasin